MGSPPPASGRALHMCRPARLIRSRSVLGSCFRRRCPTWEKEPDLDANASISDKLRGGERMWLLSVWSIAMSPTPAR